MKLNNFLNNLFRTNVRNISYTIVLASLTSVPVTSGDDNSSPRPAAVNNAARQILADFYKSVAPTPIAGMSVAVIKDGALVHQDSIGFADIKTQRPTTPNTRYRLYSTAKSLTAVAAMRLVEQGRLELDTTARSILTDLPQSHAAITVRHLMGNKSGIRHYRRGEWLSVSGRNCSSPKEAMSDFINDPLEFEPGSQNAYSTFGFVVLSELIGTVHGDGFENAMRDLLFKPAGMDNIAIEDRRPINENRLSDQATFYLHDEELGSQFLPASDYPEPIHASCKFGGGGFVGSAMDLARFGATVLSEDFLSDAARSELWSDYTPAGEYPGYGLGFFDGDKWLQSLDAWKREQSAASIPERRFPEAWFHGGSAAGGYSLLFIYPEHNLVLAMAATNAPSGNSPMLTFHDIASLFFQPN